MRFILELLKVVNNYCMFVLNSHFTNMFGRASSQLCKKLHYRTGAVKIIVWSQSCHISANHLISAERVHQVEIFVPNSNCMKRRFRCGELCVAVRCYNPPK